MKFISKLVSLFTVFTYHLTSRNAVEGFLLFGKSTVGVIKGKGRVIPLSSSLIVDTHKESFVITKKTQRRSTTSVLRQRLFRKNNKHQTAKENDTTYEFNYQYNVLLLREPSSSSQQKITKDSKSPPSADAYDKFPRSRIKNHRCVLLIPPIGVGIGRWYYDRLLSELSKKKQLLPSDTETSTSFIAPDLLASASAARPTIILTNTNNDGAGGGMTTTTTTATKLPMFTVRDWSDQLTSLMRSYEDIIVRRDNNDDDDDTSGGNDDTSIIIPSIEWCIVSNGGCSPIALELALRSGRSKKDDDDSLSFPNVTSVILSASPRLSFFLDPPPPPSKLDRSYRRLSGLVGSVFWWYALRKNGKFVYDFSVKNLASSAEALGDEWLGNCLDVAKAEGGMSRYSTFAFLAGALNGGCRGALEVLGEDGMRISIVSGGDRRKNPSRSWFWTNWKRKKRKEVTDKTTSEEDSPMTLTDFLRQNGNGGEEIIVGGRRCPAHEDAKGTADAILQLINKST